MDEDHAHWNPNDVTKWLDENDAKPLPRNRWETTLPADEAPQYRGHPRWYDQPLAPHEEILKEHPATMRRRRLREWSERFGWVYDLYQNLAARYNDLWTPEFIIGFILLWYGLGVTVTVWTFGSYVLSHPAYRRTLPTVEEIMHPEPHNDGSLQNLTDEQP